MKNQEICVVMIYKFSRHVIPTDNSETIQKSNIFSSLLSSTETDDRWCLQFVEARSFVALGRSLARGPRIWWSLLGTHFLVIPLCFVLFIKFCLHPGGLKSWRARPKFQLQALMSAQKSQGQYNNEVKAIQTLLQQI